MAAFDASSGRFVALQRLALPVVQQPVWRIAADPLGRCVAAASLDGTCALFAAAPPGGDAGSILANDAVTVHLHAPCWSVCFTAGAPATPPALLALLPGAAAVHGHGDGPSLALLHVHEEPLASVKLPVDAFDGEITALEVLPVPGAPDAALLLCEGGVVLLRGGEPCMACATLPGALPSAWQWAPSSVCEHAVLVLATHCGVVLVMHVDARGMRVRARQLPPVGSAQAWGCISAIAWLSDGAVLACTHEGDGMLLRLREPLDAMFSIDAVPTLEHVAVLPSTSPALDVALPNDGCAPLLACGSGWAGSLRTVLAGCEVQQLLLSAPSYPGVTGVWPVSLGGFPSGVGGVDVVHELLLVSFVGATRALALEASRWRDVSDDIGLDINARTLEAGTIGGGVLLQVCASGVRAVQLSRSASGDVMGTAVAHWTPPVHEAMSPGTAAAMQRDAISVASVAHGEVLLGLAHEHTLVLLRLHKLAHRLELVQAATLPLTAELSCICVAPPGVAAHLSDAASPASAQRPVAVVGTYAPQVAVLSLAPGEELRPLATWVPPSDASTGDLLPNAVHVARYLHGDGACVLVGTRAGALLRLQRRADAPTGALRCEHSRVLGRAPLGLVPLCGGGAVAPEEQVLALSERPWLLRMVAGMQRVSVAPLAPPAAQCAAYATPLTPPGLFPCVLLVTGARLRLVALRGSPHACTTTSRAQLGVAPRCVTPHAPSGSVLLSYSLPPEQTGDATRHELCAVDPAAGTPVSEHARLRTGETVHVMAAWPSGEATTDCALLLVGTSVGLPPGTPPEQCELGRLLIMRLDLRATQRGSWRDTDSEDESDGADSADEGMPSVPQHRILGSGEWVIVVRALRQSAAV